LITCTICTFWFRDGVLTSKLQWYEYVLARTPASGKKKVLKVEVLSTEGAQARSRKNKLLKKVHPEQLSNANTDTAILEATVSVVIQNVICISASILTDSVTIKKLTTNKFFFNLNYFILLNLTNIKISCTFKLAQHILKLD